MAGVSALAERTEICAESAAATASASALDLMCMVYPFLSNGERHAADSTPTRVKFVTAITSISWSHISGIDARSFGRKIGHLRRRRYVGTLRERIRDRDRAAHLPIAPLYARLLPPTSRTSRACRTRKIRLFARAFPRASAVTRWR